MKKLEIGAGEYQRPDYEQLDFRPLPGIQYVCDARKLPFPDETYDEIFSSQTLEHFSHLETDTILKEWVRVIKLGGRLVLGLPDFLGIYQQFLDGKETWEGVVVRLYGHQDYIGNTHFTMFRYDYFEPFMIRAGLKDITINRYPMGDGFEAIGTKQRGD